MISSSYRKGILHFFHHRHTLQSHQARSWGVGAAGYTQVTKVVTDEGTPGSPGSVRAPRQGKQLEQQWHKPVWWEGVFTPTLDTEAQGRKE